MCREFVVIASCVGPAGRHGYNQTKISKDKRWANKPKSGVWVSERKLRIDRMDQSAV